MANGSIGTPRVYVDYIQWAKLQGMIDKVTFQDGLSGGDAYKLFDMNPTEPQGFSVNILGVGEPQFEFMIYLKNKTDSGLKDMQFRLMISAINYCAVLGHNVGTLGSAKKIEPRLESGYANVTEILGEKKARNNVGTNIIQIDEFVIGGEVYTGLERADKFGFKVHAGGSGWNIGDLISIGAVSIGRFFDFPHNIDMQLRKSYNYEQAQTRRTWGGADLTQYNYTKKSWGGFSPWTNIDLDEYTADETELVNINNAIDNENYTTAGFQGKRSWDLSLSFVSDREMFPMSMNNNVLGYYHTSESLGNNIIKNTQMNDTGGVQSTAYGWEPSDDVPLHWAFQGQSDSSCSIVTGNGFSGNAVRCINPTAAKHWSMRYEPPEGMLLQNGRTYKVSFMYRSNSYYSGSGSDTRSVGVGWGNHDIGSGSNYPHGDGYLVKLPTNEGDAVPFTFYLTINQDATDPPVPSSLTFFGKKKEAGTYVEFDNVHVREVFGIAPGFFDESDNIVGSFLSLTHGGSIPFIFQPDNTVNTDFALCVVDQKSIKIRRVTPDLYNIKLRVKEI